MLLFNAWRPVYDDPPAEGGDPPPTEKRFTQAEVNDMMGKRTKKLNEEKAGLLKQLEQLQQSASLTEEEKTSLQGQIETLQASLMTKEELSAKEKKALEKRLQDETEKFKGEATRWQRMYSDALIERTIVDAAASAEALKASQILAILRPNTRLVEVPGEDGKPSGSFVPKVKFQGRDKDGKPVTLDLTVQEAIAQMKEMPDEYGNLFKSGATGGLGQTNVPGSRGGINWSDTSSYIEARKKGHYPGDNS